MPLTGEFMTENWLEKMDSACKKNGYRLVNDTWYPPGWTDKQISDDTLFQIIAKAKSDARRRRLLRR